MLMAERTDDNVAVPPAPERGDGTATASTVELRWWPQTPLERAYEVQHQYLGQELDPSTVTEEPAGNQSVCLLRRKKQVGPRTPGAAL